MTIFAKDKPEYHYKRLLIGIVILFCISLGFILSQTYLLSIQIIDSQAFQNAQSLAHTINKAGIVYSERVVQSANTVEGITVSANHRDIPGHIPTPISYLIELSSQITMSDDKAMIRIYSDYPFPNREAIDAPKDSFERTALDYLKTHPQETYTRKEQIESNRLYRYAEAIIMKPSCVECHNSLPESPKKDWKVGDVRGILEISQPIKKFIILAHQSLYRIWVICTGLALLTFLGLILIVSRLRNINKELQAIVSEKTASLRTLASIDGLTQLYNRRHFDLIFQQECQKNNREGDSISLILCDIDHFKQYNDTYGHKAGDDCLQKVAQILQNSFCRAQDVVARYGGEEFIILLPHTNGLAAKTLVQEMMKMLDQLNIVHEYSPVKPSITLCSGIVTRSGQLDLQPDELLIQADEALYEAKRNGRNCFVYRELNKSSQSLQF